MHSKATMFDCHIISFNSISDCKPENFVFPDEEWHARTNGKTESRNCAGKRSKSLAGKRGKVRGKQWILSDNVSGGYFEEEMSALIKNITCFLIWSNLL